MFVWNKINIIIVCPLVSVPNVNSGDRCATEIFTSDEHTDEIRLIFWVNKTEKKKIIYRIHIQIYMPRTLFDSGLNVRCRQLWFEFFLFFWRDERQNNWKLGVCNDVIKRRFVSFKKSNLTWNLLMYRKSYSAYVSVLSNAILK